MKVCTGNNPTWHPDLVWDDEYHRKCPLCAAINHNAVLLSRQFWTLSAYDYREGDGSCQHSSESLHPSAEAAMRYLEKIKDQNDMAGKEITWKEFVIHPEPKRVIYEFFNYTRPGRSMEGFKWVISPIELEEDK